MKRNILLVAALCLSLLSYAQKAPKKSFLTEIAPLDMPWVDGEQINFSDSDEGEGVVYTVQNYGTKTYFMGKGACRSEEGNWLALYPASALRRWEGACLYFNIPHEQVGCKNDKPMYSRTQSISMDFKPLTAYLTFTLAPGQPPVKEIRICANKYISGSYMVDLDAKSVSVQLDTGERFREIILKPQDGDVLAPGDYTMSIFARVLPDGLTVEIVGLDGKVETRKIGAELTFKLGKTRDIGIIDNLSFDDETNSVVGNIYGDNGVIFWVNPDDHSKGKAVSATASVVKWAESNGVYGIHNFKENYEKVHSTIVDLPAYKANPENFQAIKACEEMRKADGGNWHVPSALEMKYLFNAYYGKTAGVLPENGTEYTDEESLQAAARFDAQLESMGGEGLLAKPYHYWICGQNSSGNVQYVDLSTFHNGNSVQTEMKYVRCVRDFHVAPTAGTKEYPQTEIGKLLKSDKCPKIIDVIWDTTYTVTGGLDYYQMVVLTETYDKLDLYLLRTDPSKGLEVRAAVSGESTTSTWKRQVPTEMAAHLESQSNTVYALVNADFCENRLPIRPRGPLHSDGQIWVSSYSIDPKLPQQALSYVGVTFDGMMTIAPTADYSSAKKSLKECTGAGVILLNDYQIQGGYVNDPARDPRTAIGHTEDNIVWILAVDGRHKGAEGMTYLEMATIFKSLGCIDAVNLDGGGSTQMLVRDPQTDEIQMRNWPSDPTKGFGGRERARLNFWVIMKR